MKTVIMAGGQGTRFWPASRRDRPKQFLNLTGHRTLLRETLERLLFGLNIADMYVVCGPEYREPVARELPELDPGNILIEPLARSTAACIGLAAVKLRQDFPNAVMAVLPSDHLIRDWEEFHEMLLAAGELADAGWLVTFGIEPEYPATGYGYIEQDAVLATVRGRHAYGVRRFLEKPDRDTAERLLSSGNCKWNSGMFVWRVDAILSQIEIHMPELSSGLKRIEASGFREETSKQVFELLKPVQIDVGVLEKSGKVATLPCKFGWSDVGSWRALESLISRDASGHYSLADAVSIDSSGCVLYSDGGIVALVGVEDLVVVKTGDAVLVCSRDQTERVKDVVEALRRRKLEKFL